MADEEVIKRRLLIDGDGTGDDRRLNVLVKSFIKWVNTNDSAENIQTGYDRLLAQLAQVEFAATKSDYASHMQKQELRNYELISQTIDAGIEQAKTQIDQSKENLVLAKTIRKNRMEYDVLAKIISAQPDRRKTTEKLDQLQTELGELENSQRQLQRKLDVRKNDFAVLMRSIRELQAKLDDDVQLEAEEEEEAEAEELKKNEEPMDGMNEETSSSANGANKGDIDEAAAVGSLAEDVEMVSPDTSAENIDPASPADNSVSNGTP